MTPEELEGIIDGTADPDRRATAYAALTLTRLLSPDWVHTTRDTHERCLKAAGQTVGDREGLQKRLDDLLAKLREPEKANLKSILPMEKLKEIFEKGMIERVQRSYTLVMRPERKARLHAVELLSVELAAVKAKTLHATALAEGVIEDIIEGEWEAAARAIEDFTFSEPRDPEDYRKEYAAIYERFVLVGRTLIAEHARMIEGERQEPN